MAEREEGDMSGKKFGFLRKRGLEISYPGLAAGSRAQQQKVIEKEGKLPERARLN